MLHGQKHKFGGWQNYRIREIFTGRKLSRLFKNTSIRGKIFNNTIYVALSPNIRPLFVGFMFFIRKFSGWYAGGRVITITHYTHFKFLLSKFSQIMAKIIIMNVGIDKTFLKFKFSQEIINNGEKCG